MAVAPHLNLMAPNPTTMLPTDFASICSIMGIKPITTLPDTSAAPVAPATTTVFVKGDDKVRKAEIYDLIAFYNT